MEREGARTSQVGALDRNTINERWWERAATRRRHPGSHTGAVPAHSSGAFPTQRTNKSTTGKGEFGVVFCCLSCEPAAQTHAVTPPLGGCRVRVSFRNIPRATTKGRGARVLLEARARQVRWSRVVDGRQRPAVPLASGEPSVARGKTLRRDHPTVREVPTREQGPPGGRNGNHRTARRSLKARRTDPPCIWSQVSLPHINTEPPPTTSDAPAFDVSKERDLLAVGRGGGKF